MTHTLTVTEEDVVCAQRLHATPSASLSVLLVAGAVIVVVGAYAEGRLPAGAAIGALAGMFGWLAILFLIIIPYRAKRIYRQQKNICCTKRLPAKKQAQPVILMPMDRLLYAMVQAQLIM